MDFDFWSALELSWTVFQRLFLSKTIWFVWYFPHKNSSLNKFCCSKNIQVCRFSLLNALKKTVCLVLNHVL